MKKKSKNTGFTKIPEVKRKEFEKKNKTCFFVGQKNTIFATEFCVQTFVLPSHTLYFLPLMTGQAYLTIAAVVSVLG